MKRALGRGLIGALVVAVFSAAACANPPSSTGGSCADSGAAPRASTSSATPLAPTNAPATLTFKKEGKLIKTMTLAEITKAIPPEVVKQYDPYYSREKSYRAVPLAALLNLAFANESISTVEYVLRATDGYTVPMRGALATEPGAYVAFEDIDVPGWEPIGQNKANPAPFYVIWANKDQANVDTHPRPYELATIEIAKFEEVFPHTAPTGADAAAQRGFERFKQECVHCHAINREGGRVGPELNVPMSIVEYRPADQIKAYIKNPRTFRYSQMPPHDTMSDGELDDLVAYFSAMKDRKNDPDAATATPTATSTPTASATATSTPTATATATSAPASTKPRVPPLQHRGDPLDHRD